MHASFFVRERDYFLPCQYDPGPSFLVQCGLQDFEFPRIVRSIGLCRAMYGYVGLCMAMLGYVGLCIAMQGYVGLCRSMYGYVGLCMAL